MSAMSNDDKRHFKRHPDDEIVDEVVIKTRVRWKTSGLSGDEWRTSASVELRRNGNPLYSRGGYRNIGTAVAHLPWLLLTYDEDPEFDLPGKLALDRVMCDQPGCGDPADVVLRIVTSYSSSGHRLHDEERSGLSPEHRRFCAVHAGRGDCGREDSDRNYVLVGREPGMSGEDQVVADLRRLSMPGGVAVLQRMGYTSVLDDQTAPLDAVVERAKNEGRLVQLAARASKALRAEGLGAALMVAAVSDDGR